MENQKKLSGLTYEILAKNRPRKHNPGYTEDKFLSNEELSFCNFCHSIINACYYLNIRSSSNYDNGRLSMFLENVEREVLSWVERKGNRLFLNVPNKVLFEENFGSYYSSIADFILLQYGWKRKNNSTLDKRENCGQLDSCDLEKCKTLSIKQITKNLERNTVRR